MSRRSVLRGAAGAGAAGIAAGALIGPAGQALAAVRSGGRPARPEQSAAADARNVIVHIRDARSGEMDIFSGATRIRRRDKAVAARLASLAATADAAG